MVTFIFQKFIQGEKGGWESESLVRRLIINSGKS